MKSGGGVAGGYRKARQSGIIGVKKRAAYQRTRINIAKTYHGVYGIAARQSSRASVKMALQLA